MLYKLGRIHDTLYLIPLAPSPASRGWLEGSTVVLLLPQPPPASSSALISAPLPPRALQRVHSGPPRCPRARCSVQRVHPGPPRPPSGPIARR